MNLLSRIASMLRRESRPQAPSTLRNRIGGMAWILLKEDDGTGSYALHRRIVTTVRLRPDGMWQVDPPQRFMVRQPLLTNHMLFLPGDIAVADGMVDAILEPIPDTGVTEEEVAVLYAPKVPERAAV